MGLATTVHPSAGRALASGTDEELLRRFAYGGDQGAFAALVRRHGPAVYGVCRRILHDDHLAEDAFQNTFMVLARKAVEIDRPAALAGWLYGVALRVALKARPNAVSIPLTEPATDPTDPSGRLVADELRVALDEEVARLPDADRDLLVLVYLDGKTHDEAARAVGCPLGSVAWRLGKARDNLRRQLLRRGIELSVGALLLLAFTGRAQAVSEGMIRRTTTAAAIRPGPATGGLASRIAPVGILLAIAFVIAFAVSVGLLDPGGWDSTQPNRAPAAGSDTARHELGAVSAPAMPDCPAPP